MSLRLLRYIVKLLVFQKSLLVGLGRLTGRCLRLSLDTFYRLSGIFEQPIKLQVAGLKIHLPVSLFLQSNLLEASPESMQKGTEKEWYYGNKERERLGPFSFKEVSISICKVMKNLFAVLFC